MLREQDVNHGGVYRVTGWNFEQNNDGVISAQGSEIHAMIMRDTHRVLLGGKPLPTVEAVQDAFQNEGVI